MTDRHVFDPLQTVRDHRAMGSWRRLLIVALVLTLTESGRLNSIVIAQSVAPASTKLSQAERAAKQKELNQLWQSAFGILLSEC